ncbi:MAG: tryptophan--tRNA ligase [Nanoarchaeota archaeon]|nr:tryptophan--tRNA ligase [Nanoarchaeota archaeon]
MDEPKKRVLSGMRPTGRLHIGHIESVLRNWINLQKDHDCFYFVADWHALTTDPSTKDIEYNSIEMVKDWLAFGVDPKQSTVFLQSQVPEHTELSLIFSMLTNIGRLERVPSFKAQLSYLANGNEAKADELRGTISQGFLGYPVLQAADILIYKTDVVPVGEDQVPHIELTREIARSFNTQYGGVFVLPEVKLSYIPKILGTDGQKMSKSYGNTISPEDSREDIAGKVRKMVTDTNRKSKTDPGDPNACSVYDLHLIYQEDESIEIGRKCRNGEVGCFDCKSMLTGPMTDIYAAFRERRPHILDEDVKRVLREGSERAREVASATLQEVRHMMMLDYL